MDGWHAPERSEGRGIAAGHAHRFHALDSMQYRQHFVFSDQVVWRQAGADFCNAVFEKSIVLTSIMSTPGGRRFGLPTPRALRALGEQRD